MSEYIVRDFKESDKNQVVDLLQTAFDPNMTKEYWEWLYSKNPEGYYSVVAELNGEIAGNDGFIPIRMKVSKNELTAIFNASLVVSPRHRRKGLFLKMGTYATTELAKNRKIVCVGFPNEIAYHGHLKYGWFTVSSMVKLVKFLSTRELMRTQKVQTILRKYHLTRFEAILPPLFRLAFKFIAFKARLKHRIERSRSRACEVIESSTPFPNEINDLWLRAKDDYEILTVRDKRYLDWRFHECPEREYSILLGKMGTPDKEEIVGYLVMAQENRLGLVLDIFGIADSGIFDVLIHEATRLLKKRGVEKIITRIIGNNEAYKAFRHNGWFIQETTSIIARVNTLEETPKTRKLKIYLSKSSNWYVTAVDNL